MRLVLCAVSAIALSGCSWLGGLGQNSHPSYNQSANSSAYGQARSLGHNPCQIPSAQHPIPRGCNPAAVTIATQNHHASNGFPQTPQFGQPSYTTGQYGSHAAHASQQGANYRRDVPSLRKPKFRGTLSLGAEKSLNGEVLDYAKFSIDPITGLPIDPTINYDPRDFNEGRTEGSVTSGLITQTTFTAGARERGTGPLYDRADVPNRSLSDAWSTPVSIAIGGEYILSPRNTVFANVGYAGSSGESVRLADVTATLYQDTISQEYDTETFAPIGGPLASTSFIPDEQIATFSAKFSDMKRYDLEVGGRHYFNSWNKNDGLNTVTPFLGASVGASHFNAVSFRTDQRQRFYEQAFNDPDGEEGQFYNLDGTETTVELYDSQWVPTGELNAGVEWQVTPRTGLAFETGVRFEGAREYTNNEKGDTNIAIPFTIRGSYNF